MTTEEKINSILEKLSEKKEKDRWEKLQIVATICTGILTILLTGINLWVTKTISEQSQQQASYFHKDQARQQKEESDRQIKQQKEDASRKEVEQYIQELNSLPSLTQMLSSPNTEVRQIAKDVLESIKKNEKFNGHLLVLVKLPKEEKAPEEKGDLYRTASNSQSFWVYMGQKDNGKWQTRVFNINQMPSPQSTIQATTAVFRRDHKPIYFPEKDSWSLGKITGVLKEGSTVLVLDTMRVEGNNLWALVK